MVQPHPIRIVVSDDLDRSRLTVAFRIILAIPHLIWVTLWTIAAVLVAIVNWVVTLVAGRTPQGLHNFFAAYVRYTTHLYAYLYLAANPYPGFVGDPGYPVDLEIDPPAPQRRWTVAFRLVLSVPALLIAGTLGGITIGHGATPTGGGSSDWASEVGLVSSGGVAVTVAFLAWFACLVRGGMPLGFRDLLVYALRYSAQATGYLFLLTDRYPTSDPFDPPARPAPKHQAIRIVIEDDLRRSRLTVFFRLLLALPHIVWLLLWGVAAVLALLANWFATLALGRSPDALHRFLSAYLRYQTHVGAFIYLIANPFPGFTGKAGSYPLDLEIDPPGRQPRLVTLFRVFLAIPALFVASALGSLVLIVGFLGWFAALVTGRMPLGLRNAGAFTLRYQAQTNGYAFYLVTAVYPYSGPAERAEAEPVEPEAGPGPEPWQAPRPPDPGLEGA
jgi:uncharacterized protein DUF4389